MKIRNGFCDFIDKYLPPHSKIITIENKYKTQAITVADLDGDGEEEIILMYWWKGDSYILILKNIKGEWSSIFNRKGKGERITYFNIAPITDKKEHNLIIGWKVGTIWSKLGIFKWEDKKLKPVMDEIIYSKIGIEDMPGINGRDGKAEIALWTHDTGEAYKINVFRYEKEKLEIAEDVYPYYFEKVCSYYKTKLRRNPELLFYWYYLADAQLKAGRVFEALHSVSKAEKSPYPPKNKVDELKKLINIKIFARGDNLYPVSVKTLQGNKWGYINNNGKFVINPIYDYAMDFQPNGLAVVGTGNLQGLIDNSGQYVVKPKYESISAFSEGLASVVDEEGFKVINEKGEIITFKPYSFIGGFSNGRALVGNNNELGKYGYGYLDKEGNEVIKIQYENATDFKEGKALVKLFDDDYKLIDINGKVLSSYDYNYVGNYGEGYFAFQPTLEEGFGYINEKGEVVIKPQYTGTQSFSNGRAVVNTASDFKNKYGLIDNKGKFIVKPQYNDIVILGEDRIALGKAIKKDEPYYGSVYAIGDIHGNILTDFIYYDVSNFNNGVASANDGKHTFFINKKGEIDRTLPILEGTGSMSFIDNLIRANVDYKTSYYDKGGKLVWREQVLIPLNDNKQVTELKYKPNKDYIVYYPMVESIVKNLNDKVVIENINKKLEILSEVKPIDSNIQLEYNYIGDFAIEFYNKNLFVPELYGYEYYFGAAHGMPSRAYPHINLNTGEFYELKDLFKTGSNYVEVLSSIIDQEIKNNKEYAYVFPDVFKTIKPDQTFYVDKDNLYIYFVPYEIAPYAAGFPTFKIPFKDIMNIINTEGGFWKSFN